MNDHAVRVWVGAAGQLLDDARKHLDVEEFFELVDLLKGQLTTGGRRGPELVIRFPIEDNIVFYLDARSSSESDRLRDWLRSNADYAAIVDAAVDLARRERERRAA